MQAGYIIAIILGVVGVVYALVSAWQRDGALIFATLFIAVALSVLSIAVGVGASRDDAKAERVFARVLSSSGGLVKYDTGGEQYWMSVYTWQDTDKRQHETLVVEWPENRYNLIEAATER